MERESNKQGFLTMGSLQEYILKHCIQNIFSTFQILYSIVFIGHFLRGPVEKPFLMVCAIV